MLEWIASLDRMVTLWMPALHNPVLDTMMVCITHLGTAGLLWIVLLSVLLLFRRTRANALYGGAVLAVASLLANIVLKSIFLRERPYLAMPELPLLIGAPSGTSFPSGHSASSFAVATSLWFCRKRIAIPATILASLIAFSRIYLYCHYLSDVVAGALLGIAVAVVLGIVYQKTIGKRFPLRV